MRQSLTACLKLVEYNYPDELRRTSTKEGPIMSTKADSGRDIRLTTLSDCAG
mgnify:CR=1 FL=1